MRAHGQTVELRGDVPREILDVFDAVSVAQNRSRISLVIEVLHEWALRKHHEATLVIRVTQDHPPGADSHRNAGGMRGDGRG